MIDIYICMNMKPVHRRFSIINSLMIVIFLSGMVAMIMLKTLNQAHLPPKVITPFPTPVSTSSC